MAKDAQKTVSQKDSRNFYGVTFTQDASTPVFKTAIAPRTLTPFKAHLLSLITAGNLVYNW